MDNAKQDFELHVQVELASVDDLNRLIRRQDLYLVHHQVRADGKVVADILTSGNNIEAVRAVSYELKIVAKLNQPEDLKKEVSQVNRFQKLLDQLRKKKS